MNKVSEIVGCITDIAPLKWQESWDNAGLLVGDANMLIDKALVTLDVTEAVIDEAIENGFHLVISHHPLIYRPLKHILPENTIERTIIKAIKHDIAIACMHTNLDNSYLGVSKWLADRLGLKNLHVLEPMKVDEDVVTGGGMVGELEKPLAEADFLALVKKKSQRKSTSSFRIFRKRNKKSGSMRRLGFLFAR